MKKYWCKYYPFIQVLTIQKIKFYVSGNGYGIIDNQFMVDEIRDFIKDRDMKTIEIRDWDNDFEFLFYFSYSTLEIYL